MWCCHPWKRIDCTSAAFINAARDASQAVITFHENLVTWVSIITHFAAGQIESCGCYLAKVKQEVSGQIQEKKKKKPQISDSLPVVTCFKL